MFTLIPVKVREDYEEYDPSQSHDGGSYYQPTFVVEFMSGLKVRIDDTSCGDFGDRIDAVLYMGNQQLAGAHFGSMYDDRCKGSDFTEANQLHVEVILAVRALLGYWIPTKEGS